MTTTFPDQAAGVPPAPAGPAATQVRQPPARWARRLLRGRESDQPWVRPALLALLTATALLYSWGLGRSGWANAFYSAAVQAGSTSWKAFFFGSSDASNFITVDKPPASLWVAEIFVRLFGLNSWSVLVPQALEGVAAVGVLYATVRRWFSPGAALLAGAVFATTPVAVLMFRFNNPDSLLVLLLVLGAYATVRAVENASTRWIVWAGVFVGFGFLTKMMQTFLVVPAFALTYLLAAPAPLRRRIGQLLLAGAAMLVAAGWWVAVVELWPKSSRPYIGGSQNNSVLNLIFGYNGFGRLNGNEAGSVGGMGGAGGTSGRWGATGLTRMFNSEMGGQVSWLIPAALILLIGGLAFGWRAPRTDRTRAALALWGGWLLVTGITLSLAQGIIHPYYTVALAPAIGAVIGIGGTGLWHRRGQFAAALLLAMALAATTAWAYVLLNRTPSWHPWLRPLVLLLGGAAIVALILSLVLSVPLARRAAVVMAAVSIVAGATGPAAYAVATASAAHTGAIPSAGPTGFGGPGRGFAGGPGPGRGFAGGGWMNGFTGGGFAGGSIPPGTSPGGPAAQGGTAGLAGGFGRRGGAMFGRTAGGLGGLLNAGTPSAALVTALRADAGRYIWVAAAVGSNSAAGVQLATGDPVMAIGGFNGTDPTPTLAQFQEYVSQRKIHYFMGGGGMGMAMGGGQPSGTASAITAWVQQNFSQTTIGGTTVYDLTTPAG
ncbi:glycosyltransferase family 39 protein [Frankia sp. Cj3]|uniref:glycosyltransferase family 39 protein n=1 Tax=Frankia sp. Cj3 TaxID=2880976 RepID=UPI001EF4227B|nr:glycosyltransferase family 39 protein [Frankia sp. Cj3]